MTTTPAMTELPEPELGYIETDKSRQPAFSARQMRAAMQAQPAAVSDAEIEAATTKAVRERRLSWLGFKKDDQGEYTIPVLSPSDYQFARAILALRPQSDSEQEKELRRSLAAVYVRTTADGVAEARGVA